MDRMKLKIKSSETKISQLEEELNEYKYELETYKYKVLELKQKLRHKEESIFKNKLIKDKTNASFELDNSVEGLIDTSQYFTKRKKFKGDKKQALFEVENINNQAEGIFQSYESDEMYGKMSAEKENKKKIELENGEMFDSEDKRRESKERRVEDTWFFKVLNELFSPYKILDQHELLNLVREKYGKFLQSEELMQIKSLIEIILGLPKNSAKSVIINKVREIKTSSMIAQSEQDVGVKVHDFENTNKNLLAFEEMKHIFESIKASLKMQPNSTITDTLKAVKKALTKKIHKDEKKKKSKINPSKIALRKTKIDLDPSRISYK